MTKLHHPVHAEDCSCSHCLHLDRMPTWLIEQRLSTTHSSEQFDSLLSELDRRLDARSL